MKVNINFLRGGGILVLSLIFMTSVFATQPMPTPGTYGSSTAVGRFTIDSSGKITGAQNVNISFPAPPTSLPPSGPAGGDLSGTYPNPNIGNGAVTFSKIAGGNATAGQILTTDGAGGLSWSDQPPSEASASIERAANSITSTPEDIAVIDSLPLGQYVIMAKLNVSSSAVTEVDCEISEQNGNSAATFDTGFAVIPSPPPGFGAAGETISMLTVHENPANIHLRCNTASGAPGATVGGASLVAMKVGSVTQ